MTDALAYFILNMLPGVGPVRVRQLAGRLGGVSAILDTPRQQLAAVSGIGDKVAGAIADWRGSAWEEEAARCERAGILRLTPADADYPTDLLTLHDPPLCLYVKGDAAMLNRDAGRTVAVVGTRRVSRYGAEQTEALAMAAVHADWVVTSGLARGIDTIAHQTVVKCKGRTVAALGGGLGAIYPQENAPLARAIVDGGGAILSEQPLMMPPDRHTFPMRNRIISGLSRGVIVVEASLNSGSLITASQALEQGKTVFAVPGNVSSPQSRGCHRLLKDGARLVESFDDILEEFSFLPLFAPAAPAPGKAAAPQLPPLSDRQQTVVDALSEGESGIDQLVAATGLPISQLLTELFALEMKRVVRQLPGKRFVLYIAAETTGH